MMPKLPERSARKFGWSIVELTERQIEAVEKYTRAYGRAVAEACARIAEMSHLVPPDGGSPTEGEREVAHAAGDAIREAAKEIGK